MEDTVLRTIVLLMRKLYHNQRNDVQ